MGGFVPPGVTPPTPIGPGIGGKGTQKGNAAVIAARVDGVSVSVLQPQHLSRSPCFHRQVDSIPEKAASEPQVWD